MDRRTFLAGAAGASSVLAGCVGSAPETPDDGPATTDTESPTGTPTPESPSITSQSLESRGDCDSSGSASIATDGTTVTVEGCIAGRNGCMVAALASASYDADADELSVRVTTEDESEPDEACTQAIVHRGYRVTVEFDGALPGSTTVVHAGMNGEQQVAQSETGE